MTRKYMPRSTVGLARSRVYTDEENMAILRQRIEEKVATVPEAGCWLWLGATRHGYGITTFRSKLETAHRLSFQAHKGVIGKGQEVRHTCDTRSCVNPTHLLVGSKTDNMRDAVARMRNAFGERHGIAVLTDAAAIHIRESSESASALAERYGVTAGAVRCVRRGQTWRHLLKAAA